MGKRTYSNTAAPVTLTAQVNASAVTLQVGSTTGYPDPTVAPFTIAIERGTPNEEVCLVTAKTPTSFTVTRGYDGTSGKAHAIGVAIEHTVAKIDFEEANAHANDPTIHQTVPTGALVPFAGASGSVPSGWLLCAGQVISRTTYAALFAVLGTTYGAGDGSTTFGIPDLRGRMVLALDNMNGSSANRVVAPAADTLGGSGGVETVALTSNEMPSHSHAQDPHSHATTPHAHGITDPGHTHAMDGDEGFRYVVTAPSGQQNGVPTIGNAGAGAQQASFSDIDDAITRIYGTQNAGVTVANATATTQLTGGGAAHQNMPPYLAMNFIIRT